MAQPDMHGKVCLITGSNAGIGKATALGLAQMGATIVMVSRDKTRGEAARAEVIARSGNERVDLLLADLSAQSSIRQLTQEVIERYPQLHVLINNAGIAQSKRTVTVDGIETIFAVNYLAPFLLTNLLLDRLKASAPARIINVASMANRPLDFDDLQHEKRFSNMQAYSRSKFAVFLFTHELARRLEGTGVTVNCLHPGVVATNLLRGFSWLAPLAFPFITSPQKGAETSIYLASSPEVGGVSGKYFIKCKEAYFPEGTDDRASAQRLWEMSEQLTGTLNRT